MKEYVYLDTELLNSTLAQFNKGLINSFTEETNSESTQANTSQESKSKGIDGAFQLGVKYVNDVTQGTSMELTNGQTKVLDYVLDDYAVDVLIDKIKDFDNYNSKVSSADEGSIVNFKGDFHLYDFELIKKITNSDIQDILFESSEINGIGELEKRVKLLRAQTKSDSKKRAELKDLQEKINFEKNNNKQIKETFQIIHKATSFANSILGGSLFLRSDDSLSLCKREHFRLNEGQLAMLTESKRKINVLAIVSGKKEKTHKNGMFDMLDSHELNKIPSMFTDVFLSNFNMIRDGDKILTPIAIFFE